METVTPPVAVPAADAGNGETIAEDRIYGAAAIGRFIDPQISPREARRLLEDGIYPCWREGRTYVASKAALLRHWRQKTAQLAGQSQKSARRVGRR